MVSFRKLFKRVDKTVSKVDKTVTEESSIVADEVGKGIVSGLAGTAAITLSQMVDMKITQRPSSDTPVKAAGQVVGFEPTGEIEKERLNNLVHFAYGTIWGEGRSIINLFGIRGWKASLIHFGAVWTAALVMLPSMRLAPPIKEWGIRAIAKDAFHHAVYAFAAGFVYDKLSQRKGLLDQLKPFFGSERNLAVGNIL